jgi:hypothetical protein
MARVFLVLLLAVTTAGARAEQATAPMAPASVASVPVFSLISQLSTGETRVVDGKKVRPEDWPALVSAVVGTTLESNRPVPVRCSGTLVGPGALLTAAHCFDPGTTEPFRTQALIGLAANRTVALACTLSPQYAQSPDFSSIPRVPQDFALCFFDAPGAVRLPLAETVDAQQALAPGSAVLMSGWGCRSLTYSGGRWDFAAPATAASDLALTIADGRIEAVPAPGASFDGLFATLVSNLSSSQRHPALCKGDSGGPLFGGASVQDPTASRRVRAVNSRVGPAGNSSTQLRSSFAPLASEDFRAFAHQWLATHPGARICGLEGYAATDRCRL